MCMYAQKSESVDPIGSIQDFLTAKTTDDMVRAFVPLQGITTVQPVEAVRRVSRQLGEVNRAYLLDAVRAAVEAGRGGRDAAVAWEDAGGLPVPAVPSPVFSERACRLLLRLGKLRSLEQYRCHREQLLAAVRFLPGAEAETVSSALAEQLQDLLIEEVLGGEQDAGPAQARQLALFRMLRTAARWRQDQLALYFLTLQHDRLSLLLPCMLDSDAPAKHYKNCAAILRALACQRDAWEYESLLRMLHDKVEGEVLRRVRRAQDDTDTQALRELYVLLRSALDFGNPEVWLYPCFAGTPAERRWN